MLKQKYLSQTNPVKKEQYRMLLYGPEIKKTPNIFFTDECNTRIKNTFDELTKLLTEQGVDMENPHVSYVYYKHIVSNPQKNAIRNLYMYNTCIRLSETEKLETRNAMFKDIPNMKKQVCDDVVADIVKKFKKTRFYLISTAKISALGNDVGNNVGNNVGNDQDIHDLYKFKNPQTVSNKLRICFGQMKIDNNYSWKECGLTEDISKDYYDVLLLAYMSIYVVEQRVIDYYMVELDNALSKKYGLEILPHNKQEGGGEKFINFVLKFIYYTTVFNPFKDIKSKNINVLISNDYKTEEKDRISEATYVVSKDGYAFRDLALEGLNDKRAEQLINFLSMFELNVRSFLHFYNTSWYNLSRYWHGISLMFSVKRTNNIISKEEIYITIKDMFCPFKPTSFMQKLSNAFISKVSTDNNFKKNPYLIQETICLGKGNEERAKDFLKIVNNLLINEKYKHILSVYELHEKYKNEKDLKHIQDIIEKIEGSYMTFITDTTKGRGGGNNNIILILGRNRKIRTVGRTKHVMYKKQLIKLSEAKKLEKRLKGSK